MPKIFEAEQHHIGNIRDALVIKFAGLDNSEEHPGDPRFRRRLLSTIREFHPTNEDPGIQAAGAVMAFQPWEFLTSLGRREFSGAAEIRRYVQTITELATDFGLRPMRPDHHWWGYDWLHDVVSNSMRMSRGNKAKLLEKTWWCGKGFGEFTASWKYTPSPWERDPWTDKNEMKAQLLSEFEDHWKDGDRRLTKGGFSVFKEREMIRHIHWLFLAICPDDQLARPLTYQEIANREFPVPVEDEDKEDEFEGGTDISNVVNEDGSDRSIVTKKDGMDTSTVTKAVLRLAKILDIDLGKRLGRRKEIMN